MKNIRKGVTDYEEALELQCKLVEKRRKNEIPDTLVLLQHPPVITLGTSGNENNILVSKQELTENKIQVVKTNRGGDVTLHCPGQLVCYPVIDLRNRNRDVQQYLHDLEQVVINVLVRYGIKAVRNPVNAGVWVGNKKIASIGIGVRHWITFHGVALNVNPDLKYFDLIRSCGLENVGITSMQEILGDKTDKIIDMGMIENKFVEEFNKIFGQNQSKS